MASFIELQDSPMFHKQVGSLEQTSDELKDRCQRLYGACKKFMAALGEACNGDTAFADALEAFSGGQDDPVSMSIGGPVISKFINAFRELSSYKEHLHSQVEHVLIDRLMDFMTVDLQDAKESRQRFDKSTYAYDQAREKFVSLKKSAREDVAAELEEDLQNSKSVFERSRFSLVNALMNVEAKKKYQFLESFSAIMDAHLRYFKLGYELLSQMEPFIHQVLTYAQQSKEVANIEQDKLAKRIQEFRTQAEMDNIHASRNLEASTGGDGRHNINMGSYKNAEAIMETTANGAVQTIKQGYLLKRSASLRADRKRKFFVLDSSGTLYYYRNKVTMGPQSNYSIGATEQNNGMFGRFRSKHQRSSSLSDEKTGCRTIDLRTSTIKIDANDTDLRLCFRIISPSKTYILQAENAAERMDWINKINGAISSLFNSQFLQQDFKMDNPANSAYDNGRSAIIGQESLQNDTKHNQAGPVSSMLRQIPGNDLCAECSSPEPDWASLNLGILMCIECSGAHRNLGVHISKVRSITLDVKVWEPTILELFRNLGNGFCNSVWEEVLRLPYESLDKSNSLLMSITKPCPRDDIYQKEKYIQLKYAEKLLVSKEVTLSKSAVITSLWGAVKSNSLREVYRLIIISDRNIINATYDEVDGVEFYHHVHTPNSESNDRAGETKNDPSTCDAIDDSTGQKNCLQGCSLLHLAIQDGNSLMVELLLQFGANINLQDHHGRTPLHHCIHKANIPLSKYLLKRGARPSIKDGGGLSALERSMEMGAITDEELFVLLTASD